MISVCMATFNGGLYLRQQIDSILCQLNPGDELIISDDGSTDDTLFIIKSYNDSRIKYNIMSFMIAEIIYMTIALLIAETIFSCIKKMFGKKNS